MDSYLHNQAIDFIVPLVDELGQPLSPTAGSWTLFDEADQPLASGTFADLSGDSVTVAIEAQYNQIHNGEVKEGRGLHVELTLPAGNTRRQALYYLLELDQTVVAGKNSFIGYVHALRLMPDFPQFSAFNRASDEQRRSALVAAWRNIDLIELRQGALTDSAGQPLRDADSKLYYRTGQLNAFDLAVLHPAIFHDLAFAQMVEAEFVLGGDGNEDLRAKGVMSYSVGEVKQFFRTAKPLEWAVSKHALRYIGKYVQYNRRLARA